MKFTIAYVLVFFSLSVSGQVADSTVMDLIEMSLEDLINVKVVTSKTNLNSKETPSIVTIITREEIKNMGARDLMDVLNQIPGFNFCVDVLNTVGPGARGNWGIEGKILLLIDGNEMNEVLFGTTQFGQHYDISNIDKVEIIRGPGSSIYGGYAELGVINIMTRNGQQMKEASLGFTYGNTGGNASRKNARFNMGGGNEKVNYSFSSIYGEAIRSDKTYTDIYGSQIGMAKNSMLRPLMVNGGINAGKFSMNMIYDGYYQNSVDEYDQIQNTADRVSLQGFYTSMKYEFYTGSKLVIIPKVNYKIGTPYYVSVTSPYAYDLTSQRIAPAINIGFNPKEGTNFIFGLDSYFDKAKSSLPGPNGEGYFHALNADNSVSFSNLGLFGQGHLKIEGTNITLGARMDHHSQFGSAFSPRVGITKSWRKTHVKALYNQSFRAPSIENIRNDPGINPEKTHVTEVEFGYSLSKNMLLTANGYYIQIIHPIVFFVDESNPIGTYKNFNQAGSAGFEIEYKMKQLWGGISANFSYFNSQGINKVPYYNSGLDGKSVLAFPGSRVNFHANLKISKVLSINPSTNITSKRYGVTGLDQNGEYIYSQFNPQMISNIFLRAKSKNIDAGIGIYNVSDERQIYLQPYSGGHAPLPGLGREFLVTIQYSVPMNK